MLLWLILLYDFFCCFRSVAINSVYKLQFFYIYSSLRPCLWPKEGIQARFWHTLFIFSNRAEMAVWLTDHYCGNHVQSGGSAAPPVVGPCDVSSSVASAVSPAVAVCLVSTL